MLQQIKTQIKFCNLDNINPIKNRFNHYHQRQLYIFEKKHYPINLISKNKINISYKESQIGTKEK